jgi:protein tyrosine/serine phosphatase
MLLAGICAALPKLVRDLRDNLVPRRFGVVEPGLIYRSGQISERLVRQTFETHQIDTVVDLTFDNPGDARQEAELAAIRDLGITRRLCPLSSDGTGDVRVYSEAVRAIVEENRMGRAVLVHCAAGTQRTGGVIAAYRLLVQQRSPAEVFEEMADFDYDPRRSPRLLEYLNSHLGAIASELLRSGAISRVPDPLPVLRRPG